MESTDDRKYRRAQERKSRKQAMKVARAAKQTHYSHVSTSPCEHTQVWDDPSAWAPNFTKITTKLCFKEGYLDVWDWEYPRWEWVETKHSHRCMCDCVET